MRLRYRLAISAALIVMPWACGAAQVSGADRVKHEIRALRAACGAAVAEGAKLEPEFAAVCAAFAVRTLEPDAGAAGSP